MLPTLNLHRSETRADWVRVPVHKRNPWQRIAAATHGVATPANLISFIGALITGIGLIRIVNDISLFNILLITVGRLADIADGYVANKTMTKSPLGEIIDAGTDKILAFAAVVALVIGNLAPLVLAVLILVYSIFNSFVSIAAKIQNKPIHPSREGKFAGAACWALIGFCLLYTLTKDHSGYFAVATLFLVLVSLVLFIWYGLRSSTEYYRLWRAKI